MIFLSDFEHRYVTSGVVMAKSWRGDIGLLAPTWGLVGLGVLLNVPNRTQNMCNETFPSNTASIQHGKSSFGRNSATRLTPPYQSGTYTTSNILDIFTLKKHNMSYM